MRMRRIILSMTTRSRTSERPHGQAVHRRRRVAIWRQARERSDGARAHFARRRRPGIRRDRRAFRLRQDQPVAARGRPDRADAGFDHARRDARHRSGTRPRHGVPVVHFVSLAYRAPERRIRPQDRAHVAGRFIHEVGLEGFEDAYPKHLSGGMMQRVALARALANDPAILLMDEPFGALDSQTRSLMQELLLDIWQASHKTVLFITHDIDESILLGDRVYVMTARPGRIKEMVQIDIPRPRNVDVLTSVEFITIKRRIMALIHDEAVRAMG